MFSRLVKKRRGQRQGARRQAAGPVSEQ
jgi:hypothetical protein